MSNLQKNHVKIDVFNEPKYRFDPNQVHSSSFHPHKTPKKQKNIIFGTSLFWSKCLRLLYLRNKETKNQEMELRNEIKEINNQKQQEM